MIETDKLLEQYKQECSGLLERSLKAEQEKEFYEGLYHFVDKARAKQKEELAFCKKAYDELEERFNRALKIIEEHMEVDDAEF